MSRDFENVFSSLKKFGFLLESDSKLPSVCSIIVGEPIRGSWWSHPLAQRIFQVNEQLEDHAHVLITKLISGKVTFVHRNVWSEVVTIGSARDSWQLMKLAPSVKTLLELVEKGGSLITTEVDWPRSAKVRLGDAVRELEKRLLIVGTQFHSESGTHEKHLETWEHWAKRRKFKPARVSGTAAKITLGVKLKSLNDRFDASAKLPWQ